MKKLFRVTIYRGDGVFWEWFISQRLADKRVEELRHDEPNHGTEVERVSVPTSTRALARWLNDNAPDQNG